MQVIIAVHLAHSGKRLNRCQHEQSRFVCPPLRLCYSQCNRDHARMGLPFGSGIVWTDENISNNDVPYLYLMYLNRYAKT